MSSRCPSLAALLLALCAGSADARELRVCADPNNLPFSNQRGEGFENKLAELLARELKAELRYTWWAQRRGFIRSTLKAGLCDLVMGVPARMEMLQTTRPYYRSSYAFVTRREGPAIESFDDTRLKKLRVGVQLIGDDGYNSPPAHALAQRGIVQQVRGYTVYGNYAEANPAARIVEAVARKEVDVAVVWGPLAGYFGARHGLRVQPVAASETAPVMDFAIAMGLRRGEPEFLREIETVLDAQRAAIDAVLAEYKVPRLDRAP